MSEESAEAAVSENERNMAVFRAGYVGIATNIALAGVKAFIGLAANSISVVLDAVNNLSDAVSSVVTIIGTKFASAEADGIIPLGMGASSTSPRLLSPASFFGQASRALSSQRRKSPNRLRLSTRWRRLSSLPSPSS